MNPKLFGRGSWYFIFFIFYEFFEKENEELKSLKTSIVLKNGQDYYFDDINKIKKKNLESLKKKN